MKSLDDLARIEAETIADLLPESHWRQAQATWLSQREPRPTGSFRDKSEFIELYVLGARLTRDKTKLKVATAYKAIDPQHQFDQLITISFDKTEFRPEMVEQFVKSIRQKAPKVIDYDQAIARPEFCASVQTDPSFNPHIHIYTPKLVKDSAVTNAFVKRFVSCKKKQFPIYNANVIQRPHPAHYNYIRGDKSSKEKIAKIDKDTQYRKTHNIAETYPINQLL